MKRKADPQAEEPVAQPGTATAEDGWLQRWSQRKRRAGAAVEPDNAVVAGQPAEVPACGETDGSAPEGAADEAEEPELPPIESLDEHSDFRVFLSEKVSEELRLQALRKLFSLPQFNVRDSLNDYDEDFASFKPLGEMVPHDMARSLERALKKAAGPDRQREPVQTADVQPDQQTPRVAQVEQSSGEEGVREDFDNSDGALPKG